MNSDQRSALTKIANDLMSSPTIGQAVGASFESFKTGLKDKFNPKAWIANRLTAGNYTKDRKLAARQQYYADAQQKALAKAQANKPTK